MQYIEQFKAWLLALHTSQSAVYFALLTATIYGGTLVSRKVVPAFWATLEHDDPVKSKILQSLPVGLAGVVLHGFGSGSIDAEAFWGLVFSALAIAIHHGLKASNWGPLKAYQGELGVLVPKLLAKLKGKIRGTTVTLLLVSACAPALLPACLPGGGVDWPKVAKCAPGVEDVIGIVSRVLFGSGDVKTELAEVAREYGQEAVVCAVNTLQNKFTAPGAASSPERAHASERAAAFLDEVGTKFEN